MTKHRSLPVFVCATTLVLMTAGCSAFSNKPMTTLEPEDGYIKPVEEWREPVAQVTALEVAPSTTGAIVTATGLTPTQGYWGAALVPENKGLPVDGVITYHFLVAPPPKDSPDASRVSTPDSREITAAAYINVNRFAETRKVVVIGANGSRTASR